MPPLVIPLPEQLGIRKDENITMLSPSLVHGWVDQSNTRGIIDILQSCVVTIFAATLVSV